MNAIIDFWVDTAIELLRILVSWPAAVLVVALVLLLNKAASQNLRFLLNGVLGFKSLKVFGAELVFSEEARLQADEALKEYRSAVTSEYGRFVTSQSLDEKLSNACRQLYEGLGEETLKQADARFTVHVPDAIFTETFVQLLHYYPAGDGAGRTKSIRFGIIGKAWRSGETVAEASVPTDQTRLIVEWGMTEIEARRAGSGRKSFAAVPLLDTNGNKIAVFFMDARPEGVFLTPEASRGPALETARCSELQELVRNACQKSGLDKALEGIREKVWEKGIRLTIYD